MIADPYSQLPQLRVPIPANRGFSAEECNPAKQLKPPERWRR